MIHAHPQRVLAAKAWVIPLLISGISLMIPAFWNGYPILFPDTGRYLAAAHSLIPWPERAIGYSYLILAASPFGSLWALVFIQSLLISSWIIRTQRCVDETSKPWLSTLLIAFLACVTSLGWFASQVMPDGLTAGIFLIPFLVLYDKKARALLLFDLAVFFLILISQSVNWILGFAVVAGLWLWSRAQQEPSSLRKMRLLPLILCLGLAPGFLKISNFRAGYGASINPRSATFLMGRVYEAGLLAPYLEKECPSKRYVLCKDRKCFMQASPSGEDLLWHCTSPLTLVNNDSSAQKVENQEILAEILTDPRSAAQFLWNSIWSAGLEFSMGAPNSIRSTPWFSGSDRGKRIMPAMDLTAYQHAGQMRNNGIRPPLPSSLYLSIYGVALLVLLGSLVSRRAPARERLLSGLVLSSLLFNALLMATLSGAYDRYQGRISWMAPMAALLLICRFFNAFRRPPPLQGNQRPDRFDNSKGPGSLEKPIN